MTTTDPTHGAHDLYDARWWSADPDRRLHCYLCPRHCRIGEGQVGFCNVRLNLGGRLRALAYASPAAVHIDPIEKKPFYHFLPGTRSLSIGTAGCSLGCRFCQNWELSRSRPTQLRSTYLAADEVVDLAVEHHCDSIAFTYNEPIVWAEYAIDIAKRARAQGIRTLLVTNGYITAEAFHDVFDVMDAVNVDLKSFDEQFYRRVTLGHLDPVLETLERIHGETAAWLEITHLMIPGLNDDPGETRNLVDWVLEHLGAETPVHFSAFHPDYRMLDRPPTPAATVRHAQEIARRAGILFAYSGNVAGEGAHTSCPWCGTLLIEREWNETDAVWLDHGACPGCRRAVPGVWGDTKRGTRRGSRPHRPPGPTELHPVS